MKKLILVLGLAFFAAALGLLVAVDTAYAYSNTTNITAQTVVPAICTIGLNVSSINFGTVNPGADTGAVNQAVNITNTGNTAATATNIKGSGWASGGNTMAVGQTEYNVAGFTYGAGTDLTAVDAAITGGNLAAGSSVYVYFGVGVPAGQVAATYSQNITLTMNC